MARKVFITSDISHDEALLEVAVEDSQAALIWPWILTMLDDWGRAEAHPMRIKAKVFPMVYDVTPDVIQRALDLYSKAGLVTLYEVDGTNYVAVDEETWRKWQTHIRWDRKADGASSRFPAPDGIDPGTGPAPDGNPPDNAGHEPDHSTPSPSPSPSPSTRNSPSSLVNGNGGLQGGLPNDIPPDEWEIACQMAERRRAEGYPVKNIGGFARRIWEQDKDQIRSAVARGTPTTPEIEKLLVLQTIPEDS